VIRRLLIANRGEIAIRIARAARELGISPVGVYSDADERAAFRDALDASVNVGPGPASESYLRGDAIVAAARALGADAVHPGYGFLSERAPFAQAVHDAGLVFVGPSPAAIAAMGSKSAAKAAVRAAGVPTVPGYDGDDQRPETLRREAAKIGTPLLVKASAGGGGRGMRVVTDLADFDDALAAARREALGSFGDDAVLLERYLPAPRHIEVQILADEHGTIVHLGERECSIQRRYQKVVEETPSTALDDAARVRIGGHAVAAARAVTYTNAGTVEFLLDGDGSVYFLEMNARLQVEHPITELVYGVDLVHAQLRIAAGEPLGFAQADLRPRGWAIEARLTAEDPAHNYAPQAGKIVAFDVPQGPGVRVDAGFRAGSTVPPYYDSLLAKICAWGHDRPAALARLQRALAETRIVGIPTNLPLLRAIAADAAFAAGATTTRYLEERASVLPLGDDPARREGATLLAAVALAESASWRIGGVGVPIALVRNGVTVRASADRTRTGWRVRGDVDAEIADGRRLAGDVALLPDGVAVTLEGHGFAFTFPPPPSPEADAAHAAGGSGTIVAPMPGKIVSVSVAPGEEVAAAAVLVVLEAMKMEHRIEAPIAGTVESVRVAPGDLVGAGAVLVTIGAAAHD
jgi:3-methylcrotonyl-CoA carboxylase alpha subunit